MTNQAQFLTCHSCGRPVHQLTPEQARRAAADPDAYVTYCSDRCRLKDPDRYGGFW